MTKRNMQHTGKTYGAITVVAEATEDLHWIIRWECCGREEEVDNIRINYVRRNPPKRCVKCVLASVYPGKARRAELREAKKDLAISEPAKPKKPDPTLWGTFLGKMGHRYG